MGYSRKNNFKNLQQRINKWQKEGKDGDTTKSFNKYRNTLNDYTRKDS